MNIPVLITLYVLAALLLAFAGTVTVYAIKFLRAARENKKKTELVVKLTEERVRKEYNRIALLDYDKLNRVLSVMFSRYLILSSDANVSEKDPNAYQQLYASALAKMIEYLGPETMKALDYHYGDNYVIRWAESAFRSLEFDGVVSNIVHLQGKVSCKDVAQRLATWQ